MQFKLLGQRKIWTSLPFLIQMIFVIEIVFVYNQCESTLAGQAKGQEIAAASTILSKLYYDAGLAIGAYSLTKNKMFIERHEKLVAQIHPALENLHNLCKNEPVAKMPFTEIEQIAQTGLEQLQNAKSIIETNDLSPFGENQVDLRNLYKKAKGIADQLQNKLDLLSETSKQLAAENSNKHLIFQTILASSFLLYVTYNLILEKILFKTK